MNNRQFAACTQVLLEEFTYVTLRAPHDNGGGDGGGGSDGDGDGGQATGVGEQRHQLDEHDDSIKVSN